MRLSSALDGYWLDKKLSLSRHTINGYKVIYARLVKFLGDPQFELITTNDLRRFLAYLVDEYALGHKSLANSWIALSSLWSWAERELKTPHIIRDKLKQPKFRSPVVEAFTQAEVKQLLAATEGKFSRQDMTERNRAIIVILLDTGLRASELCDLTIGDYDQGRARLHIRHGKGDKSRFVPVGQRAQKALWKYLATRPRAKPGDPFFATRTGKKLDRHNLGNSLDALGRNAGVTGVYPHRFRHTYAIEFLRAGGNLLTLQAILGHETLEMVRRYARIVDRDIDQAGKNSPADNWKL